MFISEKKANKLKFSLYIISKKELKWKDVWYILKDIY